MKRFFARQKGENPLVGAAVVGALVGITIGVVASSGESVPEMLMEVPKGVVKSEEEIALELAAQDEAARVADAARLARESGENVSTAVAQARNEAKQNAYEAQLAKAKCLPGDRIFDYKPAKQEFIVPANCTRLKVKLWGAGGGGSGNPNNNSRQAGGGGGYAAATIPVKSGETYNVYVSGGGRSDVAALEHIQSGQEGELPFVFGGSGGGASALTYGSKPLLVAAGGGGASFYHDGGAAGGTAGSNGRGNHAAGQGATLKSSGAGGVGHILSVGSQAGTLIDDKFQEGSADDGLVVVQTETIEVTSEETGEIEKVSALRTKTNGRGGRGASGGHGHNGAASFIRGGWGWANGGNGGACGIYDLHGPGGGGGGYNGGGGGACDQEKQAGGGGGGASYAEPNLQAIKIMAASRSRPANARDIDRGTAGQGGSNATNGRDGRVVIYWE